MFRNDGCYLTKQLLIEFNNASIREKRNRNIVESYLETLPDEKYYPVLYVLHHTKDEIRTQVIFDEQGNSAFLDMSVERYDSMPRIKTDKSGNCILMTEQEIRRTLPYEGKEWVERVVKQPYRNQKQFRKQVLAAYENQCAICSQKNISVLRAAHIKDAAAGGPETIENGICLCANHEIAFDQGLVNICPNGSIQMLEPDNTITSNYIRYPKNKKLYPSKDFLSWKYNKNTSNFK